MASRVFAVDLGAWSVKLAVASPGLRGATLYSVIERLGAARRRAGRGPGPGRARRAGRRAPAARRPGYIGVSGDQVFTQVLEFGFKSLRRADLDKAVGGELEGVVPVDLEDMVYTFEPMPPVAPALVAVPAHAPVAAFEVAPRAAGSPRRPRACAC